MNKTMKKTLITLAFGMGVGLSGLANAGKAETCAALAEYCALGYQSACYNYNQSC